MSSHQTQILASQCEQQIAACRARIAKLKDEIAFIEQVHDKRLRQLENARQAVIDRKASIRKYDAYSGKVYVSKSFGDRMHEMTHSEQAHSKAEAFGELADTLKHALMNKDENLTWEEAELRRLQARQVELQYELSYWLEREEAERLAAEAASKNKGRK